jgi:hypothetical protein
MCADACRVLQRPAVHAGQVCCAVAVYVVCLNECAERYRWPSTSAPRLLRSGLLVWSEPSSQHAQSVFWLAVSSGYASPIPHGSVMLYSLSCMTFTINSCSVSFLPAAFLAYALVCDPNAVSPSYYRFANNLSGGLSTSFIVCRVTK